MAAYDAALAQEETVFHDRVREETAIEQTSVFIKTTGFARHLADKSMGVLRGASLMPHGQKVRPGGRARRTNPDHDDPVDDTPAQTAELVRLTQSMARLMEIGRQRVDVAPPTMLIWLHSITGDYASRGTMPFGIKQERDTFERYTSIGQRYLCYCVRVARVGRTAAQTRYGIRFTDEQWACLGAVTEALANEPIVKDEVRGDGVVGPEVVLDAAVRAFWMATIQQQMVHIWHSPLLHFCAVLAIKETVIPQSAADTADTATAADAGADADAAVAGTAAAVTARWTESKHYSPMLAALNWVMRMMTLVHWFRDEDQRLSGMDAGVIPMLRDEHRRWLTVGSFTPMSTILEWMSFAKGIRQKEGGMPKVLDEPDGSGIRFLGESIPAASFTHMARTGLDRLEGMMDELMGDRWAADRELIDLSRITDSFMLEGGGRSFLSDPRNHWLELGYRRVLNRCREELCEADGVTWSMARVRERIRLIECCERKMMAQAHIWGGQPGRGMELTTIRYADTQQVMRNVLIWAGYVVLVTDRDKNRAIRGFGRKVARFLPQRLGGILVGCLAWLVPLKRFLMREAGIGATTMANAAYVWKDGLLAGRHSGPWPTEMLTQELRAISAEVLGAALGTADYRHVAIKFGSNIKGMAMRRVAVEEGEMDEDEALAYGGEAGKYYDYVWDLQATHGRKIARAHYAVDGRFPWQLQPEQLYTFLEISQMWHRWLEGDEADAAKTARPPARRATAGLPTPPSSQRAVQSSVSWGKRRVDDVLADESSRKRARLTSSVSRLPETSPCVRRQQSSEADPVWSGSSAHSHAGVDGEDTAGHTRALRERERAVSRRERAVARRERQVRRQERRIRVPACESPPSQLQEAPPDQLLLALQGMLGSHATWKTPEQRRAMARTLQLRTGRDRMIVVLPTGGGKSVLFTLPGRISSARTHIVVVPFVALKEDLADSIAANGVDVMVWQSTPEGEEPTTRAPSLVLVSADSVESEGFRMYVDQLRDRGRLGTIFVDEAHTIIMDASFRRQLQTLKGLHRFDQPLVMLTATLPPQLEGWFRETMLLGDDTVMVRASTVKRNIRYQVLPVAGRSARDIRSAIVDGVQATVCHLESRMHDDQKGVIYCRSRTAAEEWAGRLGCSFYHSKLPVEERRTRLRAWATQTRGAHRWIVATSGLGTGIDIGGIVAVIHVEAPWGLVDFVQQTGRGARREGETVDSVVVVGPEAPWRDPQQDDVAHMNMDAMEAFINTTGCRRVVLGEFMDGTRVVCDELDDAERCDRCRPSHDGHVHTPDSSLEGRKEVEMPGLDVGESLESRPGGVGCYGDQGTEDWADGGGVSSEEDDSDSTSSADEDSDDESSADEDTCLTGSQRLQADRQRAAIARNDWERWLRDTVGKCSVCYTRWCLRGRRSWDRDTYKHTEETCATVPLDDFRAWRRQLKFAEFGGCFWCGLSQFTCPGWQKGVECFVKDRVLRVVFWVEAHVVWSEAVKKGLGWAGEAAVPYSAWVSRTRNVYGESLTNALAVWDMMVHECFTTR